MIIGIPSMIGLSVLSDPIIKLLFGAESGGGQMLKFLSFECVTSVAYITCQAVLQGMGKMMLPIRNLAIGAVVKMVLNIILISKPSINIYGIIIATLIADITILTLNYLSVKKYIKFKLNKVNVFVKPILSGTIMGITVYFIFGIAKDIIGSNLSAIVSIAAGGIVYLAAMLVCGGIEKDEIIGLVKIKRA